MCYFVIFERETKAPLWGELATLANCVMFISYHCIYGVCVANIYENIEGVGELLHDSPRNNKVEKAKSKEKEKSYSLLILSLLILSLLVISLLLSMNERGRAYRKPSYYPRNKQKKSKEKEKSYISLLSLSLLILSLLSLSMTSRQPSYYPSNKQEQAKRNQKRKRKIIFLFVVTH